MLTVKEYLEALFPQYFDPDDPNFIDDHILDILIDIAEDARPRCLSEKLQNLAQALFTVYLIEMRSGGLIGGARGDIQSEKEGDVTITYAKIEGKKTAGEEQPQSAWEQWHRLWRRCTRGAIVTRYGLPWQEKSSTEIVDGNELSLTLVNSANQLLESE